MPRHTTLFCRAPLRYAADDIDDDEFADYNAATSSLSLFDIAFAMLHYHYAAFDASALLLLFRLRCY